MKKTLQKSISFLALCAIGYTSQAQRFAATMLEFPNQSYNEHEFGYSSVEFNGYSIYGTEANQTINIHHNNAFLFQAVSPHYEQFNSSSFGHAVGMNQDWVAASAYTEDVTPNDPLSFNEGRVYLSKNINGVPQNNFTTTINPQTPIKEDHFGEALDLSGEWMVVGAPSNGEINKGYIEIWKQTPTSWERKHKFQPQGLPDGAKFGFSVAIHGNYIVVGAPIAQKVFVYKNINNVWALHSSYSPAMNTWAGERNYDSYTGSYSSFFGRDVDVYDNKIIVGDPHTGVQKAAILTINASTTTLAHTLLPPGYSETNFSFYGEYGHAVAINDNRAVVGAPRQYVPAILDSLHQGKVFFYSNNFQYQGYLNVGNPYGKQVLGIGRSVDLNEEHVLIGAEYTNNLTSGRINEGVAFRMPFYYITETGNTPPTVAITSPNTTSVYNAPATVILNAYANDADGTINRVEFYQNSTYLGFDNTAPYTFTAFNVIAGSKYFYVKAIDNQGAISINDVIFTVHSALPPANISGPACGSINQTLLFEVSPALRTNATGFNWNFSGAAQSIIAVSGTTYKANLSTGSNFSGGQLCVGISYAGAPYYQSYCINVAGCSSNRESAFEENIIESKLISYPNPFNTATIIELATPSTVATIQVVDATGKVVLTTQATGSLTFGNELHAGIYLVKVETAAKTEFIKVVKD